MEGKTITLGTAQGETYRWTGLPKYNEEGTKILYTARETGVPDGYDENPGYVDTEGRTEITNRRRSQTGDDMSLILWLIVLGTSMSCTGISIAMQYRKSTKKDKK